MVLQSPAKTEESEEDKVSQTSTDSRRQSEPQPTDLPQVRIPVRIVGDNLNLNLRIYHRLEYQYG